MINRIVFAAGGTGGHIYPAIAVADELKKIGRSAGVIERYPMTNGMVVERTPL